MMRILHVVTHMNRGGLETMIMNYYRNIDRDQMQFDFLVHRKERADYDDEIEAMGGKIFRLPVLNPFSMNYRNALQSFFEEHKEYNIVHSHLDCLSAIPLKVAKATGNRYCIAHSHNTNQDRNLKYLLKLYYRRLIPAYADKLSACSKEAGLWMFRGNDFEVLPNAIDAQSFLYDKRVASAAREELGIRKNDFVVGHIGRFNAQKNHSFLVEIFAEIVKKNRNAKLLLVGIGTEMDRIKEKVNKRGLSDCVIFAGLRNDIPALLAAMDVFVFPSLYEGLPVTMIEAQAAGLPCFISDKVPIECKKTELVTQISLEEPSEKWAEVVQKKNRCERVGRYAEICDAGFDIKTNARILQAFYERIERGDGDQCLY